MLVSEGTAERPSRAVKAIIGREPELSALSWKYRKSLAAKVTLEWQPMLWTPRYWACPSN